MFMYFLFLSFKVVELLVPSQGTSTPDWDSLAYWRGSLETGSIETKQVKLFSTI